MKIEFSCKHGARYGGGIGLGTFWQFPVKATEEDGSTSQCTWLTLHVLVWHINVFIAYAERPAPRP